MPILPNERRPLHDDTGMLPAPVHRADAYREITAARLALDDKREREISAGDTDRAGQAEGCTTCAMNSAECIDWNCSICIARHMHAYVARERWPKYVELGDKGRGRSISAEIWADLKRRDILEIERIKQSHKGELA